MRFQPIPFVMRLRLLPLLTLFVLSGLAIELPFQLNRQSISLQASAQTPAEQTAKADQLLETGDRQYSNAQFREALKTYQQALSAYQAVKSRVGEGDTLTRIGLAYYRLSYYQRALDNLQQALTVQQEVRDRAAKGNTDADITLFLRSRDRIREVLNSLGLVYYQLAQYPKALDFHQQALQMSGRSPSYYGWDGQSFNQIGNVYVKLGQYAKAVEYYQQALVVIDVVGYPLGRDNTAKQKPPGEIQDAIYGWEKRFKNQTLVEQSLQPNYHEPVRLFPWARSLLTTTYNNLGKVYTLIGTRDQAVQFYLKALGVSRFVDDPLLEGVTLNNVGDAYNRLGEPPTALEYYQTALSIGKKLGDRALEGTTLNNIGTTLLQTGNASKASETLTAAVVAWESVRPGLTDANRVSLFDTQLDTYNRLQTALVSQNKPEQALEIAERGRARAFVELLAKRLDDTKQGAIDEQTRQPPTIETIKQVAKQQKATLVEYAVIPGDRLHIWVVSPTGAIAFRQVDLTSLQPLSLADLIAKIRLDAINVRGRGVQPAAPTVTYDGNRQLIPGLRQLHQLLIAPIADLLPQDPNAQIVFMPQDALFLVPFAALQDATGKYLIEQHTLTIAPSIQVLALAAQQRQKQKPSATSPLIVGNPAMPSISVFAGSPPVRLLPLPGAEREARAIAALLKTQPLIGKTATERTVTQRMGKASLIHLATHGLLDDFKGLGVPGAIALAPSGDDDGLLTTTEILNLKLHAEMVVLSACDTGRGTLTGDGVIGLSRALMAAGVPTVVVSLWAVPDASTATLMTEFYRNLQQNTDKAQALRQAILTTLKQYPNPEEWAAFTLIGEAK